MTDLSSLRQSMRADHLRADADILARLCAAYPSTQAERAHAHTHAVALVQAIRADETPGLMESFLTEYGLSTDEGVALMCLAEAFLRVPDADTMDALIEDKIAPSSWGEHLGQSSSSLVNASTWALMLTGTVLREDQGAGIAATLRGLVKRMGEPVIRVAVARAMREMGNQFVLGETIDQAIDNGAARRSEGYTFSYDMLGEAALTPQDADAFFDSYRDAITALAPRATDADIRNNPGISIKLSALHPRYEQGQKDRVLQDLVPRVLDLAQAAKNARMGFNIDAEESDRLDLSLDVIAAVLRAPSLAGWGGFGVVVQAYGKRAEAVIDWLFALAKQHDRHIMVRLVKGAYWDTEIKRAQVEGLPGFPVFATKAGTDQSYLCCARKLLGMTDQIYPQFATHNAQTIAAVLAMATPQGEPYPDRDRFEFQRLHGMGEALHDLVLAQSKTRCRIYAPVGAHRDLLAYLVRRLLENGANSSFVNQIVDPNVPADLVAADPFDQSTEPDDRVVVPPERLYGAERGNSAGWDLHDPLVLQAIEAARAPFATQTWRAGPRVAHRPRGTDALTVHNPANPLDVVGTVAQASQSDVDHAISSATPWGASAAQRAEILNRAADLYEQNFGMFFALLTREAGKTQIDAVGELREAVDFLRYYAAQCDQPDPALGLVTCISPWNFPLAIFTGQIAAALAAGNGVLAKPAEATALVAAQAVDLLLRAGVPQAVLQLLPGSGGDIGAALTSDPRINGVWFTGSTATAQRINRAMAPALPVHAPLVAETGGINAMIVDSTALPEQAVRDILASAFQSAGQRCSALRMLYVQKDVADPLLEMLFGAMQTLRIGQPWSFATDVGPVIDQTAYDTISDYIAKAGAAGRVRKSVPVPAQGFFVPPTVIEVGGIADLDQEIFGPVLHVARFAAEDLDTVVADINASGYGLTFGMHSRIDDRVEHVTRAIKAGNIYINRNQIGAVVGTQPFGGEGLSGTGPKAGGPSYVARFTRPGLGEPEPVLAASPLSQVQAALDAAVVSDAVLNWHELPGPTGESNVLRRLTRGPILCLSAGAAKAVEQAGGVAVAAGVSPQDLASLSGFAAVACWADDDILRQIRQVLALRPGALIPLLTAADLDAFCSLERHICIDTTAAGGNAKLLSATG